MGYKVRVISNGNVELEFDSVLTQEEKDNIEWAIAPEGYIMADIMKKLRTLAEANKPAVAETKQYESQSEYKTKQYNAPVGPKTKKIVSEKQAYFLFKNRGIKGADGKPLPVGSEFVEG